VTVAAFEPALETATPTIDDTMTEQDVLSDQTEREVDPLEHEADVELPRERERVGSMLRRGV